jgi:spermidine/putrescine-binding protein
MPKNSGPNAKGMLLYKSNRVQVEGFMIPAFHSMSLGMCLALVIAGCSGGSTTPSIAGPGSGHSSAALAGSEKVPNVYDWSDYVDPSVITAFEKEYGIKVNYDVFNSGKIRGRGARVP